MGGYGLRLTAAVFSLLVTAFAAGAAAQNSMDYGEKNGGLTAVKAEARVQAVADDAAGAGTTAIRVQVQGQPATVDISVRATSASVSEGEMAMFRIEASAPVVAGLRVGWRVRGTTTTTDVDASGDDFGGRRWPNGTAVIAAGRRTADVRIVVLEDNVAEASERFTFSLLALTPTGNVIAPQNYRRVTGADSVVVGIEASREVAAPALSLIAAITTTDGRPLVVRNGEDVVAPLSQIRPAEALPLYFLSSTNGYISRNLLDRDPARPGLQVREGDTVTFFTRVIHRLESRYAGTYIYNRAWSGDAFNTDDLHSTPTGDITFFQIIVNDLFAEKMNFLQGHTVTVTDDSTVEGEESVTLRLGGWLFNFGAVSPAFGFDLRDVSATFTILASDGPQYAIAGPAPAAEVVEGAALTVVVQSDASVTDDVLCTIIPAAAGASADEGDFLAAVATAVFTAQTTANCEFAAVVDYRKEPDEHFAVALSAPAAGGALGATYGVARDFRIADFAPPLLITGPGRVAEGGVATYTASLSAPAPVAVTVRWNVGTTRTGGAQAADFADSAGMRLAHFPSGTATIRAGVTGTTFSVYVFDDQAPEYAEQFFVGASGDVDAASSAATVIEFSDGMDYDRDDDGLIDVATAAQLAAIRYDLGGAGIAGVGAVDRGDYLAAFEVFGAAETCPPARPCGGYELSNDVFIGLSGYPSWTPIAGGGGRSMNPTEYYSAVFEGNGFVISSMTIARGSETFHRAALFGAVSSVGTIRNVGLRDVDVDAGNQSIHTGGLVGHNEGKVAACYVVGGRVEGVWAVGGLAGINSGTVIASYTDVEVHADAHRAGGLTGEATIGSVVSASYSISEVTGGSHGGSTLRGGLLGGRNETDGAVYDVQASYYERMSGGPTSCCGQNVPLYDADTSRTSALLRAPTSAMGIYAGWDKLNVDGDGMNDDAPWDFGNPFQYPVLVFGGDAGSGPARRTSQQAAQSVLALTPTLSGDTSVSEDATASYVVRLPRALPSGVSASWSWSVAVGGAVGTGDFAGTSRGLVVIAPGVSSASFSLRVAMDGDAELGETFEVSLGDARLGGAPDFVAGASLGVASGVRTTIAPNEFGRITVAASPAVVSEGATATFTLHLSGGSGGGSVTVTFGIAPVSGDLTPADVESTNYVDAAGAVQSETITSFSDETSTGAVALSMANNTATVSVVVAVDDVLGEGGERFRLELRRCSGCGSLAPFEIGVPSSAQVAIRSTPLTVSARVYLQGAYAGGGRMSTSLTAVLPKRQPYGVAPWHYPATTTLPDVEGDFDLRGVTTTIVDWVLVELRASTPGAGARTALPVVDGFAAGLLLADGRIAGINEQASTAGAALSLAGVPIDAGFSQGAELYVLIHHRNHLPVMAATPALTRAGGCEVDYCADLGAARSYRGCAQLQHVDGNWLMIAGDVNRSGVVSWGDDNLILNYGGDLTYMPAGMNYPVDADVNFDRRITSDDYQLILENNLLSSRECLPRP